LLASQRLAESLPGASGAIGLWTAKPYPRGSILAPIRSIDDHNRPMITPDGA
jgi:hypothetical protein